MIRRLAGDALGGIHCAFVFVPLLSALFARIPLHVGNPHFVLLLSLLNDAALVLSGAGMALIVWAVGRHTWDSLWVGLIVSVGYGVGFYLTARGAPATFAHALGGPGLFALRQTVEMAIAVCAGAALASLGFSRRTRRKQQAQALADADGGTASS